MRKGLLILIMMILCTLSSCASKNENSVQNTPEVEIQKVATPSAKSKVILLAGEDDCLGYSYADKLQDRDIHTNVSAEKYQEYLSGYENVLINYRSLLKPNLVNVESKGFVPVKMGQGYLDHNPNNGKSFGIELGIAEYFHYMYPNDDTYIIKFAGTTTKNVNGYWNVDSGNYYQNMMNFFDESIAVLLENQIDFEIVSFCFLGGESDAFSGYDKYQTNLELLVDSVLSNYEKFAALDGGMSVIGVSTSNYYTNYWRIDEAKKELAESDDRIYYLDTLDLGLTRSRDRMNRRYYDAQSELKLGNVIGKKIVEYLDYDIDVPSCDFVSNYDVQNYMFKDGIALNCTTDGLKAESLWNIKNTDGKIKVNVQVEDAYLAIGDGIEFRTTKKGRYNHFIAGSLKIQMKLDGSIQVLIANDESKFEAIETNDIISNIKVIKQNNIVKGYNMSFEIANTLGEEVAYAFGLVNNNIHTKTKYYNILGTEENAPYTYMSLENGLLKASEYTQYGLTFGDTFQLAAKDVWCLDFDDKSKDAYVYMTSNQSDNDLYMYESNDVNLYAEMSISILKVHNFDLWPKFGIKLVTSENTGLFFYVDAWGNGSAMYGVNLGYCTFTNGAYNNDWTDLGVHLSSSNEYQNGNFVRLAILREVDKYTLYFNDKAIVTLNDPCKIGATKAHFAAASFNMSMIVTDYQLLFGNNLKDFLYK